MKPKAFFFIIVVVALSQALHAQSLFLAQKQSNAFPIVTPSETACIYVDSNDDWLVHKAASLLQNDIERVTGKKPQLFHLFHPPQKIASSLERSRVLLSLKNGSKPKPYRLTLCKENGKPFHCKRSAGRLMELKAPW